MTRRVLVLGASGFLGRCVVAELKKNHNKILTLSRHIPPGEKQWIQRDILAMDEQQWAKVLQGVDIVINCIGIFRQHKMASYEDIHHLALLSLLTACAQQGISRFVQVSALSDSSSDFIQSKRSFEMALRGTSIPWVILQLSLVYGPGSASAALLRGVATLPCVPHFSTEQNLQPIWQKDAARAIVVATQEEKLIGRILPVAGPQNMSFTELLENWRRQLTHSPAWFLRLSPAVYAMLIKMAVLCRLAPVNPDSLSMLQHGSRSEGHSFVRNFGFVPLSMQQALQTLPLTAADRLHAQIYFLLPLLRFSLAFLWIFTGVISLGIYPMEKSLAMLAELGIHGNLADSLLYILSVTDFLLGIALLLRYQIYWVVVMQINMMVLYTIVISVYLPQFLIHPFTPIIKNIPIIIATMLILLEENHGSHD